MAALREKRLFLLDMDGTIYLDDRLFDGVIPFLQYIRRVGGRYLFLTNNSSRGVEGYIEKMRRLGIETERSDYLTSVDVTIAALQRERPEKKCYVFGTRSFYSQLRDAGIPVTARPDPDVDILLCGFDRELTFQKLEDACILLNRGAEFWATNPDWVCPTWYGSVPDCGSVCRMLTTATGRTPAGYGGSRHDPHGLCTGADGAFGGPALHGHSLRRSRRHRHGVRPFRRGDGGGYRKIRRTAHLGAPGYCGFAAGIGG